MCCLCRWAGGFTACPASAVVGVTCLSPNAKFAHFLDSVPSYFATVVSCRRRDTAIMASKMPLVAPIYLPGKEPLPPGMTESDREQLKQALKYQRYVMSVMESCVGKAAVSGVLGFGLGAFFSLMSASFAIDDPLRQTMIDKEAAEKAKKLEEEAAKKSGGSTAAAGPAKASVEAKPTSATQTEAPTKPVENVPPGATKLATTPKVTSTPTRTHAFLMKLPGGNYFKDLPAPPPQLPATTMQSTKEFFLQTGRSMYSSGKGFGMVGALYSGIECCIESYRAKNDMVNPVVGGFLAGGILARNTGPATAFSSAIAFAAFSGAIDMFLRRESKDED